MRYVITILLLLSYAFSSVAQQKEYTAYTVNNGLPSNHVYQCIKDNHGFLWIATDEGVARFDGKYFQVFTTANGLPDNEVIHIVKEKSGRIWVNCLRQSPAYFDEVQNRFINATENSDFAKVAGTVNMSLYALPDDGVQYNNEMGSFVFRNAKLSEAESLIYKKIFRMGVATNNMQLGFGGSYHPSKKIIHFYLLKNGIPLDSIQYIIDWDNKASISIDNNKLYHFNPSMQSCFVYSLKSSKPFAIECDTIQLKESYSSFGFNDTTIFFTGISGVISVYHKTTHKLLYTISGNYLTNRLYEDNEGNQWMATVDKGLLLYKQNRFNRLVLPQTFTRDNFLSVARKNGTTLAGNYYGEIIETKSNAFLIHTVTQRKPSRQRKIILAGNDVYTVSEDGVFLNYTTSFKNPSNNLRLAGKTGLLYDDTTLLVGSFVGILHIHTQTKQPTYNIRYKRGMVLAKGMDGLVYYGSTDGLYTYQVQQRKFESLANLHPCFKDRVAGITVTPDSLIWIATASKGLAVLYKNKVIDVLTAAQGLLSNSLRSIAVGKPGQIWLGTAQGISVIRYTINHASLQYSIQNINISDGLTSNEINEMVYDKDTMYVATGNGISVIPANLVVKKVDIPVRLIRMNINERDTFITSNYNLNYTAQNIQMQFAAIELNGYFKNLQYRIGKNQEWLDISGNTLTLRLTSGNHLLQIRAVDINGYTSKQVTTIRFDIATPFWKAIWFWTVFAVLFQIIAFIVVSRWLKKRKDQKLAREIASVQTAALEQQAFTSLMNPHFMFNALNSIQHYINVQDRKNANRYLSDFASLLRKSFEAAQQYFIPLEEELENMAIYMRLEQMRFSNRFTYQLHVAANLEPENWMIPTMMLQPLLENALLHGIMPSTIQGEVSIDLKEENGNLIITITDNGIGVANSKLLHQHLVHKSRGTELIRKRITALNHFSTQSISIESTEAFESKSNPGNKVVLIIPHDLYASWLKAQG